MGDKITNTLMADIVSFRAVLVVFAIAWAIDGFVEAHLLARNSGRDHWCVNDFAPTFGT